MLTVSQAMLDSRQTNAIAAVFTAQYSEILLYFDAYGFIVRSVAKFTELFEV